MSEPTDITGSWRGHYEQDGGRHGISMEVVQRGASFVGRMRDDDTVLSSAVSVTPVDEHGTELEPTAAETMSVLPEDSIVEGTVNGDHVEFDKRYRGAHVISTWVAGLGEVHRVVPEHSVRYDGRLDAGGRRLRGRWRIAAPGPDLEDLVGGFELTRQ